MPPKTTTAAPEVEKPAEPTAETAKTAPTTSAPDPVAEVADAPVAKPVDKAALTPDANAGKVRAKVINGKFAGIKPSDADPFVYVTRDQLKNFRNVLVEESASESELKLRTAAQ